jgi:hypothetical protein
MYSLSTMFAFLATSINCSIGTNLLRHHIVRSMNAKFHIQKVQCFDQHFMSNSMVMFSFLSILLS